MGARDADDVAASNASRTPHVKDTMAALRVAPVKQRSMQEQLA
jgi:hypothetical protein